MDLRLDGAAAGIEPARTRLHAKVKRREKRGTDLERNGSEGSGLDLAVGLEKCDLTSAS